MKNRDISNIEEKLMQQKKIVLEKQQEFRQSICRQQNTKNMTASF